MFWRQNKSKQEATEVVTDSQWVDLPFRPVHGAPHDSQTRELPFAKQETIERSWSLFHALLFVYAEREHWPSSAKFAAFPVIAGFIIEWGGPRFVPTDSDYSLCRRAWDEFYHLAEELGLLEDTLVMGLLALFVPQHHGGGYEDAGTTSSFFEDLFRQERCADHRDAPMCRIRADILDRGRHEFNELPEDERRRLVAARAGVLDARDRTAGLLRTARSW